MYISFENIIRFIWLVSWTWLPTLHSDAIVSQVLDELGLQMTEGLSDLPSTAGTLGTTTNAAKTPVAVADAADDDIQARLDNLRREWGALETQILSSRVHECSVVCIVTTILPSCPDATWLAKHRHSSRFFWLHNDSISLFWCCSLKFYFLKNIPQV